MKSLDQPSHFFNRELSLLEFNQRVLDQGKNHANPLLSVPSFYPLLALI